MPQAGLEPMIPATKLPQTDALDRAATGIDVRRYTLMETYPEKYIM
jgi:hypothetical protein